MADPVEQETPRLRALRNLSAQLPVANSNIASGQQAARDMQLQQAVAKAPPKANITQAAQQTGAAEAQNAGQQMVQNAQQGIKQQGQVGQLGIQEQQRASQANVQSLQSGAKEQSMDNVQRLGNLSEQAKQELYDKQMQFERDESGRALLNETQLLDYAKLNAQNQEQFKDYAQTADQLNKRNLQAMETAYKLIASDIEQKQRVAEQKKDQSQLQELAKMKKEADEKIAKERAAAANKSAMWTAGGTIAGTAVGAAFGGPAGAMVGGAAGGAVGGMVGSQT